jgi:hypothetical protein
MKKLTDKEPVVILTFRLTEQQKMTLAKRGGSAWLRAKITEAKTPAARKNKSQLPRT